MSEQDLIGLDDQITFGGEDTTIRKEHQAGRVKSIRGNKGPTVGKDTFGHWAVIDGHSFPVSQEDFAFLRGEP